MTPDPKSENTEKIEPKSEKIDLIYRTVAGNEAQHRDLQKQLLVLATEGAMRKNALLKLVHFYGQAFRSVREAIENVSEGIEKSNEPARCSGLLPRYCDLLPQEVAQGEEQYQRWQVATTPVVATCCYMRLSESWRRVVTQVLESTL